LNVRVDEAERIDSALKSKINQSYEWEAKIDEILSSANRNVLFIDKEHPMYAVFEEQQRQAEILQQRLKTFRENLQGQREAAKDAIKPIHELKAKLGGYYTTAKQLFELKKASDFLDKEEIELERSRGNIERLALYCDKASSVLVGVTKSLEASTGAEAEVQALVSNGKA
jgi:hypothetical protein